MDAEFGRKCALNLLKKQNTAVGITIAIKTVFSVIPALLKHDVEIKHGGDGSDKNLGCYINWYHLQ